jgi:hypothetical protein
MKTTQLKTTAAPPAAAPPAAAPAAAQAPTPITQPPAPEVAKKPSEHTLLARTMANVSTEDRALLYELLEDFAKPDGVPLAEAALRVSSHAFGLGLLVEDVAEFAEDFRALSWVTLFSDRWLYRFLHQIFERVNRRENLDPENVMDMLTFRLLDLEDNVDTARQVINDRPELLAEEIRKAVAERPGLLTQSR